MAHLQWLTLRSLISSCCFNFSKKDWKKSALSTCRGATHKASISAPGINSNRYLRSSGVPIVSSFTNNLASALNNLSAFKGWMGDMAKQLISLFNHKSFSCWFLKTILCVTRQCNQTNFHISCNVFFVVFFHKSKWLNFHLFYIQMISILWVNFWLSVQLIQKQLIIHMRFFQL